MFRSRLSRETEFFDLFRESADAAVEAARVFKTMLGDMGRLEHHAHTISELENKADTCTHRTIELLHKTFITPFDRDDIHKLITSMDDVLDFIHAAAQRAYHYEIGSMTEDATLLADICVDATEYIRVAILALNNLKNPQGLFKTCVEINRLENDADRVLRAAVGKLFRDEPDIRRLIKLKEVYELLETVTDRCEDVANVLEGIALEYA